MDLCLGCYEDLPVNTSCCPRCAQALETPLAPGLQCGQCLKRRPAYDQVTAPFLYQHTIKWLITGLKFHQQHKNARLLAQLLLDKHPGFTEPPDFIVPVPLHSKRLRQRGFNQAEEIAAILARQLEIPLRLDLCQRVKLSAPQSGLDAKARQKNIRNAFKAEALPGRPHLLVIDDVMTTGATVSECAKTLKKAGARRVDVWVCARA